MANNEYQWSVGEIATLPREVADLTSGSKKAYKRVIASRFICIREDTESQRGILLKVLGKATKDDIMIVGGEPFCKDDADELFLGTLYLSYPFPTMVELTEVLDILQNDATLTNAFNKAGMHINPRSTYWVNETACRLLFKKQVQYYDANSNQLCVPTDNGAHYRLSIVYFHKGKLYW